MPPMMLHQFINTALEDQGARPNVSEARGYLLIYLSGLLRKLIVCTDGTALSQTRQPSSNSRLHFGLQHVKVASCESRNR